MEAQAGSPVRPTFGTIGVGAVDADDSDAVWLDRHRLPDSDHAGRWPRLASGREVLKTNPAFFDGTKDVIEQHFATSKDGTRVPYFLVRAEEPEASTARRRPCCTATAASRSR